MRKEVVSVFSTSDVQTNLRLTGCKLDHTRACLAPPTVAVWNRAKPSILV